MDHVKGSKMMFVDERYAEATPDCNKEGSVHMHLTHHGVSCTVKDSIKCIVNYTHESVMGVSEQYFLLCLIILLNLIKICFIFFARIELVSSYYVSAGHLHKDSIMLQESQNSCSTIDCERYYMFRLLYVLHSIHFFCALAYHTLYVCLCRFATHHNNC